MIFLPPVVLLKLQALLDLKLIGVQSLLKLQALLDLKLIGVQSNHSVEYFEGPAAPTQQDPISGSRIIRGSCIIWGSRIITALCTKTRFSFQVHSFIKSFMWCYIEAVQNHFRYQTIFEQDVNKSFPLYFSGT